MKPRFIAPLIVSAVSFSAWVSGTVAASTPSQAYSSRQLFEGVFLGIGPVASRLPAGWRCAFAEANDKVDKATLDRTISSVEGRVALVDKSYFREFGVAVTSGDPGLVSIAIKRTESDLRRAVAHSDPSSDFRLSRSAIASTAGLEVVTDGYTIGIQQTLTELVLQEAVITHPRPLSTVAGLSREKYVAIVTAALATSNK